MHIYFFLKAAIEAPQQALEVCCSEDSFSRSQEHLKLGNLKSTVCTLILYEQKNNKKQNDSICMFSLR